MDEISKVHSAEKKGLEKGLRRGSQEGELETARNLISMRLTIEQIAKATGLSASDVTKLQEKHHG